MKDSKPADHRNKPWIKGLWQRSWNASMNIDLIALKRFFIGPIAQFHCCGMMEKWSDFHDFETNVFTYFLYLKCYVAK